ncbi:MAG: rRNA pseudouridine synthase [Clostridiales bacterium]|nr:rRNA pseudouridine synthase [Clostridiales bacterium]
MAEVRLQKFFTDCGVMSRRTAEREIACGKVKVNGITAHIGCKIDPAIDTVEYGGRVIGNKSGGEKRRCTYILLNKPVGYVCTMSDEEGRLTVRDLVKSLHRRVYPVGRLDMYSEGLIIMTDDGELTNKLTHPSHGLTKTYVAEIPSIITDEDAVRLAEPFEIDGYMIRRPDVRVISVTGAKNPLSKVEFVLAEGRNRQIRRMCERAGYKITRLTRIKIGELIDTELPLGHWRFLSKEEVEYLKNI